ncbi:MAG: HEAT repeat domain-containing protein [Bryobacteraceae bacterium]
MELHQEELMSEAVEEAVGKLAEAEAARVTPAFFRELCETHAEATVIRACLTCMARAESVPGEGPMADWLAKSGAYLPMLFNPDLLALAGAQRAAVICWRHDPRFLSRLQQMLTEKQPPASAILYALSVVSAFEEAGMLLPLLRTLMHHENDRVRSNAAKALCKLRPNRLLVERQMRSPDARTRANAVEGLWGVKSREAEEIFRTAAADAHHRVAVNALVGLHYQGDQSAFERLIRVSRHPSTLHRAAAVWAFGKLGDPRAIPALQALSEDPRMFVRRKVAEVLGQMKQMQAQTAAQADAASQPSAA